MATTNKKSADQDPCWDGYEQIGTKTKKGKTVPNCVPEKKKTNKKAAAKKKT